MIQLTILSIIRAKLNVSTALKAQYQTQMAFMAFCAGNAIKYIFRFSHKNGVEDLRKAEWYIDRLIKAIPGRHE